MVTVQAGRDDIVLRLDPGLGITLKIEGWPSDWYANASLHLDGDGGGEVRSVSMGSDERVRFHRLEAGRTYTLWMRGRRTEHYVLVTGLVPGEAERTVKAERGVEVTGRVVLPVGATARHRSAHIVIHGFFVGAHVDDDGSFRVGGVPPGTWPVRGSASGNEDVRYVGSATVTAPGSVTIQLERNIAEDECSVEPHPHVMRR